MGSNIGKEPTWLYKKKFCHVNLGEGVDGFSWFDCLSSGAQLRSEERVSDYCSQTGYMKGFSKLVQQTRKICKQPWDKEEAFECIKDQRV